MSLGYINLSNNITISYYIVMLAICKITKQTHLFVNSKNIENAENSQLA